METLTKLMLSVKLMRILRSLSVQLEKLLTLLLLYASLELCSEILGRLCPYHFYEAPLEI